MHEFLYDSHCHIREAGLAEAAAETTASLVDTMETAAPPAVSRLVLCGTHPQIDWDLVERATTASNGVQTVAGFGVHPWFVPASLSAKNLTDEKMPTQGEDAGSGCCCDNGHGTSDNSAETLSYTLPEILADLERRLCMHPHAIVAEIGLDKLRGPSEAAQAEAFLAQLRIAAAHQRPVSVHCVRHYGLLLQILQELAAEDTPPAIIVHAFTGSFDIAKSLLNLKHKKRIPRIDTTAAAAERTALHDDEVREGRESHEASLPQQKKKTKRGGAAADTVRIKDRIFFGVGLSTSFTVKTFAAQTLPFLLISQRVLLETDAHYTGKTGWGSAGGSAGCDAQACFNVNGQEHVKQLREVMQAVEAAALQSAEVAAVAQKSGLAADVVARSAIAAAFADAFQSVLA